MDTLIGVLELLAWIVAVLALAAAITYGVIRLTNVWQARRQTGETPEAPESS
jgi:hypothetical protein